MGVTNASEQGKGVSESKVEGYRRPFLYAAIFALRAGLWILNLLMWFVIFKIFKLVLFTKIVRRNAIFQPKPPPGIPMMEEVVMQEKKLGLPFFPKRYSEEPSMAELCLKNITKKKKSLLCNFLDYFN